MPEYTVKVNISFIEQTIDFIKTYADRCHHGKEEDILFRELNNRTIFARETTKILLDAKNKYLNDNNSNVDTILNQLNKLVDFYPKHINKEDKNFFIPCMVYFTRKEQDDMLNEFWKFDKKLIHEKYRKLVQLYE